MSATFNFEEINIDKIALNIGIYRFIQNYFDLKCKVKFFPNKVLS